MSKSLTAALRKLGHALASGVSASGGGSIPDVLNDIATNYTPPADGETGATGPAGADAVWVDISHSGILIPCDSAGAVSAGSVEVIVRGFMGLEEKVTDCPLVEDTASALSVSAAHKNAADLYTTVTVSWSAGTLTAESGTVVVIVAVTGLYDAANPTATTMPRQIPWSRVITSNAA